MTFGLRARSLCWDNSRRKPFTLCRVFSSKICHYTASREVNGLKRRARESLRFNIGKKSSSGGQGSTFGKLLGLNLLVFTLVGCANNPPVTFDLDPAQGFPASQRARNQLVIDTPTSSDLLGTQRIVIRTAPEQVAYLKGSQWATDLPSLLRTKLLGSFENAHLVTKVGGFGLMADRHLQTEIRAFDANVFDGLAHVELAVRLLDSGGRIVAGRVFSAQAPLPNDDDASLVFALNQALGQALRDIVIWAAPRI